jgi:hypothetical protein
LQELQDTRNDVHTNLSPVLELQRLVTPSVSNAQLAYVVNASHTNNMNAFNPQIMPGTIVSAVNQHTPPSAHTADGSSKDDKFSLLKSKYNKMKTYSICRAYIHEHVLFGIIDWRAGDPYTRFERFVVLVATFAVNIFVTYMMNSISASCFGLFKFGLVWNYLLGGVVSFLFTQMAARFCMIPCAQRCFENECNGKFLCLDCSKCLDFCATFATVLYILPFIASGVLASALSYDYKVYVCSNIGGARCSINEHVQSGNCGNVNLPCIAANKHSIQDFRSVQSGLICTISTSGNSATHCNVYYAQDSCMVGLCIKVSTENIPITNATANKTTVVSNTTLPRSIDTSPTKVRLMEITSASATVTSTVDAKHAATSNHYIDKASNIITVNVDKPYRRSENTTRLNSTSIGNTSVYSSGVVSNTNGSNATAMMKVTSTRSTAVLTTPVPMQQVYKYQNVTGTIKFVLVCVCL